MVGGQECGRKGRLGTRFLYDFNDLLPHVLCFNTLRLKLISDVHFRDSDSPQQITPGQNSETMCVAYVYGRVDMKPSACDRFVEQESSILTS